MQLTDCGRVCVHVHVGECLCVVCVCVGGPMGAVVVVST